MVKMFQSVYLPAFMNDDSQLLVLMVCIMMILSSLAFWWKRKDSQYYWLLKNETLYIYGNIYKSQRSSTQ